MCKYCTEIEKYNNEDIYNVDEQHKAYLYYWNEKECTLEVDFIGTERSCISIKVNNCPMCGRDLRQ